MPQFFASYDNTVARVSKITTTPSDMESTTHVLAWGLDVYYVMLRPARGFDMLQEDFSFALLIVALLGLVGSVVFMSQLLKSAQLKDKWQ